jgi:amino acid adenylation domain-containing protein
MLNFPWGPEGQETEADNCASRCLHTRVLEQAARTPERVAVRCGNEALSYHDLSQRAMALARVLRARGVGAETPVGILLPRTLDLPVALLAVLAAGGAYVPLDPVHPAERIELILQDVAAPLVITTSSLVERLRSARSQPLCIDTLGHQPGDGAADGLEELARPEGLAYLIFTSGSTGWPKGVMIEHRNAACLLDWAHREYSPQELARVVASTSITFDLSVFEIFVPLSIGGAIDLIDNGLAFAASPHRDEATLLNTVPSVARELVALGALPAGIAVVNLAGEQLPLELARQLQARAPRCRIYNLYGPSEDTTFSTGGVVLPEDPRMTIGRPLSGRHLYLLDAEGREVAPGEQGEIHVGGPGVARGYWNRPELTARSFVPDPQRPGLTMYLTGDFGRMLPDGRIQFLGRRDDQIKLRGYRIELGEIEFAVRSHPEVGEAAVVVVESEGAGPFLRCGVAPRGAMDPRALRAWVSEKLPAYMVPADWQLLQRLPLLPNGKTDRKALRALPRQADAVTDDALLSDGEARLASLWKELLGVERVGPDDCFLALGGHSIVALQLARRIAETLGAEIDMPQLLRHPTLREQAALIAAASASPATGPLTRQPDQQGPAPATPAQLRYWTLESLLPGSCRYNIALAYRFDAPIDLLRLDRALCRVLAQAPALRTVCVPSEGGLCQRALPPPTTLLQTTDLAPPAAGWEDARSAAAAFAARPFDLEHDMPLRVLAVRLPGQGVLLALSVHHIAADGSVELLQAAIARAYADGDGDGAANDDAARPSCIDLAAWLAAPERAAAIASDLEHWASVLSPPPAPMELPADRCTPGAPTGRGGQVVLEGGAPLRARMASVCQDLGLTPFQVLLGLSWAYLARLSGQDDLCVAVPVTDRPHRGLRETIGCFVNTVLMRGRVDPHDDVAALLRQARQCALAAQGHSLAPIDRVVGANPGLRLEQGRMAANVMVSVLHDAAPLALGQAQGMAVDIELPSSRFDLGLFFRLSPDSIQLAVEYDGEHFRRDTAQRLAAHWMTLAQAALDDPGITVGMLPLLTPAQRRVMLEDWNATTHRHERVLTLPELFAESARRRPDAVAIVTASGATRYSELQAWAGVLAQRVVAAGARPGDRVAVLCDRRPHLVAALLGIMMSGCAYVPLDPDSPLMRHQAMLQVAGARLLMSDEAFAERAQALVAEARGELVVLEADAPWDRASSSVPHDADLPPPDAEGLAYVIFTSGSTGTPKAVAVRHRPVHNLIDWVNKTHHVGPHDRLLFVTSASFDLSVYDVFGMLAAGGSIRIASRADVRDPQSLAHMLIDEPITFWNSAPVALDQCVPYLEGRQARALRLVFLSGDWIPVALPGRIKACAPRAEVVALGGATEAVIWSNAHRVVGVEPGQTCIPYGRPIQNARYHILDRRLEPVPPGVAGDLFIAGDVLADGYFCDPQLSAERFIADPFRRSKPDCTPHRMYRTGDRARYFADGTIEFLGRLDNQVKIRGYRVELSEIETVLASLDGVRAAHVAVRGEKQGRWLCAYAVMESPHEPGLDRRLLDAMRARLPEYMLPRAIVPLAALPLNSSGKVDRARLPEPAAADAEGSPAAPSSTQIDPRVLQVWQRVLGHRAIGPDDNFFDVGGDSVRLIATHRALELLSQRKLPLVELFRYTTIRRLSAWLSSQHDEAAAAKGGSPTRRLSSGLARVAAQRQRGNIDA